MSKRLADHGRCPVCRERVTDPAHCANCANRNPFAFPRNPLGGKRGRPTLDVQEGNAEEYFGGVGFARNISWWDQ